MPRYAANADTALDPTQGYVDSFYISGHGGCFGDDGHCDVPTEPRRPFDLLTDPLSIQQASLITYG